MKDSIKNSKKKLLALFLSAMMLSSVAAIAACKDSDTDSSSSSSSSSTSEEIDEGLIKNAGFETFDEDDAINTSVTGWSRSTNSASSGSALSSKAASGIVDLSDEGVHQLQGSYFANPDDAKALTVEKAEELFEKDVLTVRDKLAFYDAWEAANTDKKIASELSFYEALNIDSGDIPDLDLSKVNTHDASTENTKVLMIHNQNPEPSENNKTIGTAQKYTSSSTVTIKAGTSAEFSVWVKTQDLESGRTDGGTQEAVAKGAYISVTHSVGGTSLDAYTIENIDTESMSGLEATNGWKQYSFILKGSSYVDTTFSIVLGLGQGGGTYRGEYVNGYAFFDDIQCEIIDNVGSPDEKGYEKTLTEWVTANRIDETADVVFFDSTAKEKTIDAYTDSRDVFALNFYGDFDPLTVLDATTLDDKANAATTTEIKGANKNVVAGDANVVAWGGFSGANDIVGVQTGGIQATANADDLISKLHAKYFADANEFSVGKDTLLILSENGVAYTVDSTKDIIFGDYHTPDGKDAEYLAISFFVKTSDMHGKTGAGVTLVDGLNKTSFDSIDTSDIEPVTVGEKELYGDWQQYFFFVENGSKDATSGDPDSTTSFNLSFSFGPKTISDDKTSKADFLSGFAAFTDFKIYAMSKEEYQSAQSGTYAKLVTVKGTNVDEDTATGSNFDSAMATPSGAIETGLANPQNYKGVYRSDSAYTGTSDNTVINANANAGLVNRSYFTGDNDDNESYYADTDKAWLTAIKDTDAETTWNKVFGSDATQPLFIWNDVNETKSYGYIGKSTSIAANTYTAISVRVRGTGANAYIRLVDTNAENYDSIKAYDKTLSVSRNLTYWYDDDGNICTGDPSEKSSRVAFKLQSNGLYKANKSWDGYSKLGDKKDAYFANLYAYAKDGVLPESDLLVADGGASHDYTSYWNNEGMDGVAFYYNKENKTYYADRAKTVPVVDLTQATELKNRYDAKSGYELETEVPLSTLSNPSTEWTIVTFYVHTGDTAKNYRLELWSGNKAGAANAAGTYVVFDTNNPGTAESNFTGLLGDSDYTDAVTDEAAKLESVFSYFDTANYLRYNATIDEIGNGNLYESNYTPSANEKGFAYLRSVSTENKRYTVFADYQYSEKAVAASAVEEDSDTEDSTEDSTDETNPWLLGSSLAIAGVLILAVASILIRKAVKARKRHVASGTAKPKKEKKSKK